MHRGGRNPRSDYNSIGHLKASSDGQRLAVAQFHGGLEVFDFNYGTGVVSGGRLLAGSALNEPGFYGAEFSPNSNLLYAGFGNNLIQYNLQTGQQTVVWTGVWTGALQLGPNGKIYGVPFPMFGAATSLHIIEQPNVTGAGCGFRSFALPLNRVAYLGLPNVLMRPPVPQGLLVNFAVLGTGGCVGETSFFTASIYPLPPDAVVSWNFGEPSAGPGNTATGLSVSHRYAQPGSYAVTMTVREISGRLHTYTQTVQVLPRASARLVASSGPVCAGQTNTLRVTPAQPAGTLYRWHDGSTAAQFTARGSGLYWVEVTPPQQCTVRDSLRLVFQPAPALTLAPEQFLCANQRITLDAGPQPAGSTFRWQDGTSQPRLEVSAPSYYSVVVTSPTGCQTQGQVRVRFADNCPFKIPNIITPNNDAYNDYFVLEGLEPRAWNLQVFDRWGRQVHQQPRYNNDWNAASLPDAVYYYLLVHAETGQQYRGWLQVLR